VSGMKKKNEGYLVIDNVSLKEAEKLMGELKKSGRWMSVDAMMKETAAASFAVSTHGFPGIQPYEIVEFKDGRKAEGES